jgi:hypothetical protein
VQLVPWDYNPSEARTTDIKKPIMVCKDKETFIKKVHHCLLEDTDDEAIEWYTSVIRLAWAENRTSIPQTRRGP